MSLIKEGVLRGWWDFLKSYASKTRGLFPSALPTRRDEYQPFVESILKTYELPQKDSYVRAISTMVLHLGPTTAFKSKYYFALAVKKAMCNEIAFELINEIKEKEQVEAEKVRNDLQSRQAASN